MNEAQVMVREFLVKNGTKETVFPDPGINFTVNEVKKMASSVYPHVLTSSIEGPVYEGEKAKYTFVCGAKTKG